MSDVPRQLADLTPDWLSEALGAEITATEVTPIAEGEGFMGRLARLQPTYADGPGEGRPASLVAKIPTDEPGSVMLGQMLRVWEREARFYTELAPLLPVRTPRCHYAGGDESSGIFALLLEDLSGCEPGDQLAGATPTQVDAAIEWLARFHAAAGGGSGPAAEMAWIPDTATDPMYQALGPVLEGVWPVFNDKFGALTPTGTLSWVESMIPQWGALLGEISLQRTLVHSDYRVDNMFFADGTVIAIDWQSIAYGEGLYDLAYFICGSTDTEFRRANERALVARYGSILRDEGITVPGDDELFDLYRKAVLMVMTVGALLMGQLDLTVNQRAVDLAELGVRRMYTAGADLHCGEFAD
jgi:hypothetical protein